MIYITGDLHEDFQRIENICEAENTNKDDILIILGDVGINYHGWRHDGEVKRHLNTLPITLFCIHGNHEQRPESIGSYEEVEWNGGVVSIEQEFPNILFPRDGEIFNLDGNKTIVIGGAYSVDKFTRLAWGEFWWDDEQPSEFTKKYVEVQLEKRDWQIDVVLSHTAPLKYEPSHMFLPGQNQEFIDKSTETWLDEIEDRLDYRKWYCGHYHTTELIDDLEIMYENYDVFCDMM